MEKLNIANDEGVPKIKEGVEGVESSTNRTGKIREAEGVVFGMFDRQMEAGGKIIEVQESSER